MKVAQELDRVTTDSPALRVLILPIDPPLAELLSDIRHCIEADDARILDRASEKLGTIRAARRENLSALRKGMEDWSRKLHQQGVSERPQACLQTPYSSQRVE